MSTGESMSGSDIKFSIEKSHFEDLLEKVQGIVPSKDASPILRNIQFELSETRFRITATDQELALVTSTDKIIAARLGRALFPARRIFDIVKEADSDVVTVEVEFGQATVTVGKTSWSIKLYTSDKYPGLPEIGELELHSVDRLSFLNAILITKIAICTDSTQAHLNMLCIRNNRMVAYDRTRFQQAELEFPLEMQIPARAIRDLVKLLKSSEEEFISVGSTWNHLVFRIGADVLVANRLAVEFPDVEQTLLVPALKNTERLAVSRDALISAIRQVRINADQNTSSVSLILNFDKLSVRGTDQYGNASTAVLDVQFPYSESILTVNHKYLLEMLSVMTAPSCEFFLGRSTKTSRTPLMLRDKDRGVTGVVQQMKSEMSLSAMLRGVG